MSGANPDRPWRMRRARRSFCAVLLVGGLLTSTGCSTIGAYLRLPIDTRTRTAERGEAERASTARANALCRDSSLTGTNPLHVVRAGETLSEIAAYYRVSPAELYELNPVLDPDRIEIGQQLWLPADTVALPRPLIAKKGPPAPTRAQILMGEAEAAYQAARFERALALSQEARALMEAESDRSKQLAHAAFLSGSALAGLGEDERASEEFDRVHVLDAQFEPPDGWLSPRLGGLFGDSLAE